MVLRKVGETNTVINVNGQQKVNRQQSSDTVYDVATNPDLQYDITNRTVSRDYAFTSGIPRVRLTNLNQSRDNRFFAFRIGDQKLNIGFFSPNDVFYDGPIIDPSTDSANPGVEIASNFLGDIGVEEYRNPTAVAGSSTVTQS